jgi:hypothetical protein
MRECLNTKDLHDGLYEYQEKKEGSLIGVLISRHGETCKDEITLGRNVLEQKKLVTMIKINVVFMLKSVGVKSTLRTEATLEDTPGGHLGGHLVDTLEGTYGRHLGGTPGGHLGGHPWRTPPEDTPGFWFGVLQGRPLKYPPKCPPMCPPGESSKVSSTGVLRSALQRCPPGANEH